MYLLLERIHVMNNKILSKKQEMEVVKLYKTGYSMKAIAAKFLVSISPIQRIFEEYNVVKRPFGSWATGALKTTTNEQEFEIVRRYESGKSKETISLEMNLGTTVITRVLRGRNVNVRSSGGVRPYNVWSGCFDDLRNEQSAYWLGFLFAEVGIERTNISVSLSAKDTSHLELLMRFIRCEKSIRLFKCAGKYDVARIDISDHILADRIRQLGIDVHRPSGVDLLGRIPECSMNHFLRGWFDGDGCAYSFPQICFVGRKPFLSKVQEIFIERASANPVTLKSSGAKDPSIATLYYRGVYRCLAITDFLYKDASVFLERKRNKVLSWVPKKNRSTRFWG
jgi:uncharacterized protein YerC